MRVGLISDTHGLLRAEALAALRGCDVIVHGGDIGGARMQASDLIADLARLAPVHAVRGNNDTDAWGATLPHQLDLRFGDVLLRVVHDLKTMDGDPAAAGVQVVVSGHSHKPAVARRDGVLYVNPGSAGPRRFRLPLAVAMLDLDGARPQARVLELEVDPAPPRGREV